MMKSGDLKFVCEYARILPVDHTLLIEGKKTFRVMSVIIKWCSSARFVNQKPLLTEPLPIDIFTFDEYKEIMQTLKAAIEIFYATVIGLENWGR